MKKITAILLAAVMLLSLSACGEKSENGKNDDGNIDVVTTVFPIYDWAKNIVGEMNNVNLTMMLDTGVDLHSFQPTAEDLLNITECDMFIYVGGESDSWVDDALKTVSTNAKVLNLMDILGDAVKEEEIVEGMEAEEEHEHDHGEEEHDHEHEEEEGPEYDEHVWLSLKNARKCVEKITEAFSEIDPDNMKQYQANSDNYGKKLTKLDEKFEGTIKEAKYNTVLFGDRFPFRYLVDDYGLDYFAAFVGCSAESEASFETISFLADKLKELGLPAILTLEGTDHKLADTILSTSGTDAKILSVDSLQSVTKESVENGADYITIMEENLNVFSEALN